MRSRGFAAEAAKACRPGAKIQKWHFAGYRTKRCDLVGTKDRRKKLAIPALTSAQFVDHDARYDGLGDIA